MEVFLLVAFLVVSILLYMIGATTENDLVGFLLWIGFLISTLCTIWFACRVFNKDDKKLTPIEVYRGNTTLEITYRDGIAIDSVVVWEK